MEMIDSTISMLGRDHGTLAETLLALGQKHLTYGVKPEYFPFMTESIVAMMKDKLGGDFSAQEEDAWVEVFNVLIEDIIAAQNALSIEEAAKNKATVAATWGKFTKIRNYEEVGGVVLFSQ